MTKMKLVLLGKACMDEKWSALEQEILRSSVSVLSQHKDVIFKVPRPRINTNESSDLYAGLLVATSPKRSLLLDAAKRLADSVGDILELHNWLKACHTATSAYQGNDLSKVFEALNATTDILGINNQEMKTAKLILAATVAVQRESNNPTASRIRLNPIAVSSD
jgi:hypothetical protein